MSEVAPRLSIITVCFNAEDGIEATLRSVAALRFRDFEYIVIDGGSRDRTLDIIRSHGAAIGILVSEPDKGIYDAMNKGMALARGEYLLYLNAKDTIHDPGFLDAVEWGSSDFYYGGVVLVNGEREVKRLMPSARLGPRTSLLGQVSCHQCMIVRKSAAPAYNLKYRLVSDFDWSIRILKTPGIRSRRIPRYWVKYELDGVSSRNFHRCWRENISILSENYGAWARAWGWVLFAWFQAKRTLKPILSPVRDVLRKH